MQLLVLLAILQTVAASHGLPTEFGPPMQFGSPTEFGAALAQRLAAVALFIAAPGCVARAMRPRGVRRNDAPGCDATSPRGPEPGVVLPRVVWLLATGLIAWAADWPAVVRAADGLNLAAAPIVDDVLIFAPLILSLLGLWLGEAPAAQQQDSPSRAHSTSAGIGRRGNVAQRRADRSARDWVWQHVRQFLLLPLLPVAGLLACQDLAHWAWPDLTETQMALAVLAPTAFAFAAALPLLVRVAWRTSSLPSGALRTRLSSMAAEQGIALADVLYWPTGFRCANAAVVGFLAPLRYILLSDRLLAELGEDDVAAIFAHELAHLRGRHLARRAGILAIPALATVLVGALATSMLGPVLGIWPVGASHLPIGIELALAAALAATSLTLLGRYAKLLELEADRSGCAILASRSGAAAAASSGERLDAASVDQMVAALIRLEKLTGGFDRETWLHPSTTRRVEQLQKAVAPDAVEPGA